MQGHEDETNPHAQTLVTLRKRMRKAEADIRDATDELRSVQAKHQRAQYWVKGFKDVRLYVLEEVLQELELTTNAMLDDAGLVDWVCTFKLEREGAKGSVFGLHVLIESPDSAGRVKWESWSGGEAQRLRIVSALALKEVLLNRAGVEPLLEVIDEPTRGLSSEGVDDLVEYLQARATRLDLPVFLIDHAARESARFASVTTVVRDTTGSHLQGA
jgi:exonuclease SbcC